MTSFRLARLATGFGAVLLAATIADGCGSPADAQGGKLEAKYNATLGGAAFGRGLWLIDVRDDKFTAAASASTAGVLRLFTSGKGQSAARGVVSGGQLVGQAYASSVNTDKKYDEVRMVMNGNAIKEFVADPPTSENPDRVALTEAHRRNVMDPMTASIIRVPGTGDTFVPEACQRTIAVFDGRMRYDLNLVFKRLDKVKSDKGYQGTVVVCAVYFTPVAGHIPGRSVLKYLIDMRDMETWLAPIAGTRLMVPYRASIPTPIGVGIMQATEFVTEPHLARAPTSGAKTY